MEPRRFRRLLTPNKPKDPLSPKVGYGWGWLILWGLVGYGIYKAHSTRVVTSIQAGIDLIVELVVPTIGIFAYFIIRKKFIEKKTIYKSYWTDSFFAGILAYIISLLIFFVISLIIKLGYGL